MTRNKNSEKTIDLILSVSLNLFIENGYENTSIQDIINNLGGLSKGAIYHHFKSKEEIFEKVCERIEKQNTNYFNTIRDDKKMTGLEKIRTMIRSSYENSNNKAIAAIAGKLFQDPKFVVNQIREIYEIIAPLYLQPMIEEGIADGSIVSDYPRELSEVLILLLNMWVSPVYRNSTSEEIEGRLKFLQILTHQLGVDIIEDEMIDLIGAAAKDLIFVE